MQESQVQFSPLLPIFAFPNHSFWPAVCLVCCVFRYGNSKGDFRVLEKGDCRCENGDCSRGTSVKTYVVFTPETILPTEPMNMLVSQARCIFPSCIHVHAYIQGVGPRTRTRGKIHLVTMVVSSAKIIDTVRMRATIFAIQAMSWSHDCCTLIGLPRSWQEKRNVCHSYQSTHWIYACAWMYEGKIHLARETMNMPPDVQSSTDDTSNPEKKECALQEQEILLREMQNNLLRRELEPPKKKRSMLYY